IQTTFRYFHAVHYICNVLKHFPSYLFRLRLAQESVNKLTAEKKVETKKINPAASLKERLRQKEASVSGN
ncbi:hypothetical protein AB205_0101010, partial [Aquarana catesbeiana]